MAESELLQAGTPNSSDAVYPRGTLPDVLAELEAGSSGVVPAENDAKKIRRKKKAKPKKSPADRSLDASSVGAESLFSVSKFSQINATLAHLNLGRPTHASVDMDTYFEAGSCTNTLGCASSTEQEGNQISMSRTYKPLSYRSASSFNNDSVVHAMGNPEHVGQIDSAIVAMHSGSFMWEQDNQCQSADSPSSSTRQKTTKVKKPRIRSKKNRDSPQASENKGDILNEAPRFSPIPHSQSPGTKKKLKKKKRHSSNSFSANQEHFDSFATEDEVKKGLQNQEMVVGVIRINPKNFIEAYITAPDRGQDILIEGIKNRNRALEGDEVVILINPIEDWKGRDNFMQRTATVVFIRNQAHPRVAIGFLKPMADKNPDWALFSPRDARVPRIRIPIACCPKGFLEEYRKYEKQLFLVSITEWTDPRFAVGTIIEFVGPTGDIKAENTAILLENDLHVEPYSLEMFSYFPQTPYQIQEDEILKREDLRKECIFTIDPATARDLDDAMSCKELANGNLEIGVHISDVSFFVEEGTPFDKEVAERATSTYLVDTVYHMLPRELCMMCSLLPGEDKLAFSVFWEVDPSGNILDHRFTRSVINSCAQLAYEHAQVMLENPDKIWTDEEVSPVHGGFTAYDLSRVVNHLHHIATIFRRKRVSDGALRIDQPKLVFSLDRVTGNPHSHSVYVNKESNHLIEEFMLLANMTVAKRIFEDFPKFAFLRSHMPPLPYLMEQLQKSMESYGIHLDITSAGALQKSLKKVDGDDFLAQSRMMVLYARCAKPMSRAKYFCTNGVDEEDFWHYALNVPLYTHFTSPIRRYPDIMVHRLLSASLGYRESPKWVPDDVHKIASNCNKKKYSAKLAGEKSTELYLALYIGLKGPSLELAVVIDVKDRSFDVIICSLGNNQRVYTNHLPANVKHSNQDNVSSLHITWLETPECPFSTTQIIELFGIVTVMVMKTENALRVESVLMRPIVQ